uniref:NR LBD domain-containing protein n=1 Tax=Globodera rostochiensis TaxID=31243 RepID=A0A914HR67_GLORO
MQPSNSKEELGFKCQAIFTEICEGIVRRIAEKSFFIRNGLPTTMRLFVARQMLAGLLHTVSFISAMPKEFPETPETIDLHEVLNLAREIVTQCVNSEAVELHDLELLATCMFIGAFKLLSGQ